MKTLPQIAILDDYQNVAFSFGDWTNVHKKAHITVFNYHMASQAEVIRTLQQFQAICVMRERTPLSREILSSLPNLKLIVSTGRRNASIDAKAAEELGIAISITGYHASGAPEITWALLLAMARNVVAESTALREGNWQREVGVDLKRENHWDYWFRQYWKYNSSLCKGF
ncbi:Rossmann-fold NAD(P)-binding domain-containing protein [Pedobacter panaciterrae]|uniref:hypothetical protein n=1 Tax=Pedobacter panaciterrae TaxID=363849 RepID=UPI001C20567F|nr:hypothetical protein [Pedobacter panaciterrae]